MQTLEVPSEPKFSDEIDLTAVTATLWRRRVLVLAIMTAFAVVTLGISLVLPKQYTAEATLLPVSSNDPSSAIAAGMLAQFGATAGMLGAVGGSKSADLVEILGSRSMANRVIEKCKLDHDLKGWKYRSDLTAIVRKMTTIVAPSVKSKALLIRVKAKSPDLAARMANAYASELKVMLDEIGYNTAARNRRFIEGQLNRNKDDLARAEEALATFQAKYQLASLPDTVKASIQAISDLEAKRIEAEVQLKTTDEALMQVKSKVGALQADPTTMVDLELKRKALAAQGSALSSARQTFLSKLMGLPPKGMELARLQRDVQVQNAIYLALNQQFESALITESKDSDAFLVLDNADVPDRPSAPMKLVITLVGTMVGLFFGIAVALLRERNLGEGGGVRS